MVLPWWFRGKESPANAGDAGFNPGPGRTPGGGNGNPLQYPHLGNSMDRGDLWARVYGGHKESDTTEHARMHGHVYARCSPRHMHSHYEVCSSCKQFRLDSCYGLSSVLLKFVCSVMVFSVSMSSRGIAGPVDTSMFSFFKEPPYCSPECLYQLTFPPTV